MYCDWWLPEIHTIAHVIAGQGTSIPTRTTGSDGCQRKSSRRSRPSPTGDLVECKGRRLVNHGEVLNKPKEQRAVRHCNHFSGADILATSPCAQFPCVRNQTESTPCEASLFLQLPAFPRATTSTSSSWMRSVGPRVYVLLW